MLHQPLTHLKMLMKGSLSIAQEGISYLAGKACVGRWSQRELWYRHCQYDTDQHISMAAVWRQEIPIEALLNSWLQPVASVLWSAWTILVKAPMCAEDGADNKAAKQSSNSTDEFKFKTTSLNSGLHWPHNLSDKHTNTIFELAFVNHPKPVSQWVGFSNLTIVATIHKMYDIPIFFIDCELATNWQARLCD